VSSRGGVGARTAHAKIVSIRSSSVSRNVLCPRARMRSVVMSSRGICPLDMRCGRRSRGRQPRKIVASSGAPVVWMILFSISASWRAELVDIPIASDYHPRRKRGSRNLPQVDDLAVGHAHEIRNQPVDEPARARRISATTTRIERSADEGRSRTWFSGRRHPCLHGDQVIMLPVPYGIHCR